MKARTFNVLSNIRKYFIKRTSFFKNNVLISITSVPGGYLDFKHCCKYFGYDNSKNQANLNGSI